MISMLRNKNSKTRILYYNSTYRVNIWNELRRYSMVFGILLVVFAAVVLPDIGAKGGVLIFEYIQLIPLAYIYACAGWKCSRSSLSRARRGGRLLAMGQAHAWLTAPILAAILGLLFELLGADKRLVNGWQLAACGGGGAWLSVGLLAGNSATDDDGDELALAVVCGAVGSTLALPLLPLSHIIFCGKPFFEPFQQLVQGRLAAMVGFALGSMARWLRLKEGAVAEVSGVEIAVLSLLYAECACGVREAAVGGALHSKEVLLAMGLVWSCLAVSGVALGVNAYFCGHKVGSKICALSGAGGPAGLGHGLTRLPALLAAPARAAALAVLTARKT